MRSKHSSIQAVAEAFTRARENNCLVPNYPGDMPDSLEEAYAIQDAAIALWPQPVKGWKVGGISDEHAYSVGAKKLIGPIYPNQIIQSGDQRINMPVFEQGFAAIEGEIVLIVKEDAPIDKTEWNLDEAKAMVGAAHFAVEIASSPFPGINDHGPLVTISDFGNNYGLIIGGLLPNWQAFKTQDWVVETIIEDQSMGIKSSADAGGPIESLRYCLSKAAERGLPLKQGMAISTGAITGVHQAYAGQSSTLRCKGVADIHLALTAIG